MSDNNTIAVPWEVYDQLLIFLPEPGSRDFLPHSTFRGLCRAAIYATETHASVSDSDLVDSVALPYLRDRGIHQVEGRAPGTTVVPAKYELDTVRAIVQVLCDERKPADGERGAD